MFREANVTRSISQNNTTEAKRKQMLELICRRISSSINVSAENGEFLTTMPVPDGYAMEVQKLLQDYGYEVKVDIQSSTKKLFTITW